MKRSNSQFILSCYVLLFVYCFLFLNVASASEITAFGPKQYVRTTGAPNIYSDTFSAEPGEAWLVIRNGLEGEKSNSDNRVTSGAISLNGEVLFTHEDLKHHTYILEMPIILEGINTLRVELESKPGSYLSLEIIQTLPDPVHDLSASNVTADLYHCPQYIDLSVQLTNMGEEELPDGVPVAFYNGNPEVDGKLIGVAATTESIQTTATVSVSYRWETPPIGESAIYARVDDDGMGGGALEEIDELNNITSASLKLCQKVPWGQSSISGRVIDAVSGESLSNVPVYLHLDNNGEPGLKPSKMERYERCHDSG